MIELDDAVVIVTGSSRGVGAASARLLAGRGAKVVINCSKSREQAEADAAECREHSEAIVCQGAVADDAACRGIAAQAMERWGRIDGLVNNAGTTVFCAHDDLEGLDAADFQRIYAVNTIGPYQMIRAVAPHMRARGAGVVVNVSSVAGIHGLGSSLAYVASKAALNMLTVALARVLGPEIKMNTVCPGFIEGDWLRAGMGDDRYDRVKAHLEATTPLRAVNAPEDIARTIVWLLEAAPNITGELVAIDAGMGLARGNLPSMR
jgi:3-oxoacyl-[acyl-carrier protein] reductase